MNRFGRSAVVVGLSVMASACGRKGPLIYPDMMIPAAPAAVSAQQSGSVVKIKCTLPDKDRAGHQVKDIAGVKISRQTTASDQKNVCRACTTDYAPLQTYYLNSLPPTAQRFGSRLIALDSDVSEGNSYSYRIVPFTADGIDGASSMISTVRMEVPLVPPQLKLESFPTEIKVHITSQPYLNGRLLGYNLYRQLVAGNQSYQSLNQELLKDGEYVDRTLEQGVKYTYSARAVVMPISGDIAESSESQAIVGGLKEDD
jgi:predicted small lipoprotein YifL